MTVSKKLLGRLGFFYGIIISAINFMGYCIPASDKMPVPDSANYKMWIEFMSKHQGLIDTLSYLSFIIPISLCILYICLCKENKVEHRIINLPIVYSSIGVIGWVIAFLLEFVCLIYTKFIYGINIFEICLNSFLNICFEGIFIFTLAFFILDAIHRKFILPKLFPAGRLTENKQNIKMSTKFLFSFFYLSVGIFPLVYIILTLLGIKTKYPDINLNSNYVVIGLIFIFGVILLITFTSYFSLPLKKLKNATKNITAGNYSNRIDIVSCDDLGELSDNFNEMSDSIEISNKSIIMAMGRMLDESSQNTTSGHIFRSSQCVEVFVNRLYYEKDFIDKLYKQGLNENFLKKVIEMAPAHDNGKITVNPAILNKPGKFTPEEYEEMKNHSIAGARINEAAFKDIKDEQLKKIAINIAKYHHEKWDGSGYPEHLKAEEIPLEARIMALADVFEALVSKRCYKEAFSYEDSFKIIQESLGSHFDPELGKLFLKNKDAFIELYETKLKTTLENK
ncbi:MAG: HD domain-containing protein [Treponema sp.]|nr:HD domain-containing protein [Treponema sp.]